MKKIFGIILLIIGIPLFLLFFVPLLAVPFMEDQPADATVVLVILICVISGGILFPAYRLLTNSAAETFAAEILLQGEATLHEKIRSFLDANPKLKGSALRRIGSQLYAKLLKKHIEDLEITNEELSELSTVAGEFQLTVADETKVKRSLSVAAIDKLSLEVLSDHLIEDHERKKIYELAKHLEVSRESVEKILKKQALGIFKDYQEKAAADRRLTPDEERELENTLENLGLQVTDLSAHDQEELAYYKLLWDVENGNLPEIESPIILQKNEVCHLALPAQRLEKKVVTVGRTASSSGVSIKIAKGVRYRVGASKSQPIKEEVTHRHPGTLCITNKRVIFKAPKKGFTTTLRSIVSLESYTDGVQFQKGATTYLFQFKHAEIVPMMLTALINKL